MAMINLTYVLSLGLLYEDCPLSSSILTFCKSAGLILAVSDNKNFDCFCFYDIATKVPIRGKMRLNKNAIADGITIMAVTVGSFCTVVLQMVYQ